MKERFQLMAGTVFIAACFLSLLAHRADSSPLALPPQDQEKTTEQVYRNIQVLKGLPASQLQAVMALLTGSLGVRCNHCHVNQFDKDDKAAKRTARKMMQMVFDLNKGNFSGRDAITCYTCHRGQVGPATVLPLGQNLWQPAAGADRKTEAAMPTADQVLDRYEQAMGGKAALMKVTSRVMKGSRVGADGVLVPEEVYRKAPNKLLIVTSYPGVVFRRGFDGANGWARSSQGESRMGKEELAELEREAQFYGEINLKELYPQVTVEGKATVGDREAFVIGATLRDGSIEKLYFDAQTGLLVRKYKEIKTALGLFPTQTDYEDYRDVDSVKVPFSIRWSMPGRVWGRKIAEVKHNTSIDDASFNAPERKN